MDSITESPPRTPNQLNQMNQLNLANYVNITTNKALVLNPSNSLTGSPINCSLNQTKSIMNALTVEKFTIPDLEQKLNSETDLNSFLDLIEINKSLPFSKSQETLDEVEYDEKFQIKIRVREDSNLKVGSIQLLSSEEMFELHCGDTNEYMSTVNCDFIDKLDQQFVIHYGCHNLAKNSSSLTLIRNETYLKKSLNIVFPKFSYSGNDTIWIFAIKLNLVECRSSNLPNSAFSSMNNMLPLIQMIKQMKDKADSNRSPSASSNNPADLFNQLNLKQLNLPPNLMQSLPQNVQNIINKDSRPNLIRSCSVDSHRSSRQSHRQTTHRQPKLKVNRRRSRLTTGQNSTGLILKKLDNLSAKIDLIDRKLTDLQIEVRNQ